jgi:hypothetical protein
MKCGYLGRRPWLEPLSKPSVRSYPVFVHTAAFGMRSEDRFRFHGAMWMRGWGVTGKTAKIPDKRPCISVDGGRLDSVRF